MARILIAEPSADVRTLFEHMLRRLAHEPVLLRTLTEESAVAIDLVLVESADAESEELAATARRLAPGLPILATSILPPTRDAALEPNAHLVKPFPLEDLRSAIDRLLPMV